VRRVTVKRADSGFPSQTRPHEVEVRWFKLLSFTPQPGSHCITARREAESAFKAREQWAKELHCDPQTLTVELDE
jgi:hypothetical protein